MNYVGAGTVEFLLDADGEFYFMEMNTRLQVEHPVTEMITGIDLVEWQLRVAAGERFTRPQSSIRFSRPRDRGAAVRRGSARDFLPQAGRIALWIPDASVRTDHALESGAEISPFYDSMIAKVIAHGATRDEARERLARALDNTVALGVADQQGVPRRGAARRGIRARSDHRVPRRASRVEPAQPDAATLRDCGGAALPQRPDSASGIPGATIRRARCGRNSAGSDVALHHSG